VTTIRYDMTRNASAPAIHACPAKTICIMGPVGTGKTSIAAWAFAFQCMESTVPLRGVVMRESAGQLMDSTLATCKEWFGPISVWHGGNRGELELRLPGPDGVVRTHSLLFRPCRKAEEASKFLSMEVAFVWLEECAPAFSSARVMGAGISEGVYHVAAMRLRQKGAPYLRMILTFNPPTVRHWLHRTFLTASPEELSGRDIAVFRQRTADNEANLPPSYYTDLRQLLSPDLAKRFLDGEVAASFAGLPVYGEFLESVHARPGIAAVRGLPLVFGFDFGRTPAVVIGQVTPMGQVRLYYEIQLFNAAIDRLLDYTDDLIKRELAPLAILDRRCWGDPAGKTPGEAHDATPFGVLQSRGYPTQPGATTLFTRINGVKQRFSRMMGPEPGVLIDSETCPMLVEGLLGGYRYPTTQDGRVSEKPLKNEYSHLVNALEYLVTGEFNLTSGERISLPAETSRYVFSPFARPTPARRRSWAVN
jgi:hypothetical protein